MTLDLLRQLPEHVNLGVVGLSDLEAFEGVSEPAGPLAAGSALSAALVLVELAQPQDSLDDIGRLIHDNDCSCPQTGLKLPKSVKVHQHVLAKLLRQESH